MIQNDVQRKRSRSEAKEITILILDMQLRLIRRLSVGSWQCRSCEIVQWDRAISEKKFNMSSIVKSSVIMAPA